MKRSALLTITNILLILFFASISFANRFMYSHSLIVILSVLTMSGSFLLFRFFSGLIIKGHYGSSEIASTGGLAKSSSGNHGVSAARSRDLQAFGMFLAGVGIISFIVGAFGESLYAYSYTVNGQLVFSVGFTFFMVLTLAGSAFYGIGSAK